MSNKKILYVDDEPYLVKLAVNMLIKLGYQAVGKIGSAIALEEIRENGATYDLVISDQTMPQMTGIQLSAAIKALYSDLPIIICTGFNASINRAEVEMIGIVDILLKPLGVDELAQAVRAALDKTNNQN